MTEARIAQGFVDRKDFIDQVFKMKFPGYGVGPVLKVGAAGREFIVGSIEIPQAAKERYFVVERMAGGALHLIDDFVVSHEPGWVIDRYGPSVSSTTGWSIRIATQGSCAKRPPPRDLNPSLPPLAFWRLAQRRHSRCSIRPPRL